MESKPKKSRKKQQELPAMEGPGVAKPSFPDVDKAAEAYVEVRDERMQLTEQEIERKDKLKDLMKEHKLEKYEYDAGKGLNRVVTAKAEAEPEVKVKVKTVKDGEVQVDDDPEAE